MPLSDFFGQASRKAGQVWGRADRALGGWLPGGAESPIGSIKRSAQTVAGEGVKQAAAVVFNQLPDRVNLFARYMTGVGNRNLQLDPSTLTDLRAATEKTPTYTKKITNIFDERGNPTEQLAILEKQGPGLPGSGAVDPYGTSPKSVTNTLGRFMAEANPNANTIRITDTYDMINAVEDPDLVSGKIQPQKAWNEVESIWNPKAQFRNIKAFELPAEMPGFKNREYGLENIQKGLSINSYSPTFSPATRMARALMYLSGQKPEPYSVDVTIPYSGKIK